jgi:hypothetical protein
MLIRDLLALAEKLESIQDEDRIPVGHDQLLKLVDTCRLRQIGLRELGTERPLAEDEQPPGGNGWFNNLSNHVDNFVFGTPDPPSPQTVALAQKSAPRPNLVPGGGLQQPQASQSSAGTQPNGVVLPHPPGQLMPPETPGVVPPTNPSMPTRAQQIMTARPQPPTPPPTPQALGTTPSRAGPGVPYSGRGG